MGGENDDKADDDNLTYIGGSGRYPYNRDKHLIVTVVLNAYGDESGIEGSGPYCVVAGFIGSPKHWDTFNEQWSKAIEDTGDERVKEFHAKLFFGRQAKYQELNPFSGWSREKATKFLTDLLAVIERHKRRVSPAACSLNVVDFNSLTWGERQYLTGGMWNFAKARFTTNGAPGKLYPLPFHGFIGDTLIHARPDDCKVDFVFDEAPLLQEGIIQTIAEVRNAGLFDQPVHDKVGTIGFDVSERWPGIQAGDMMAHLLYSNYLRKGHLAGERRHALVSIMGQRWRLGTWTRKKMQDAMERKLSPEVIAQMKAVKSPAEIQREKKRS